MPSVKPRVLIISPALADANNGNWRTAHRWRRFLSQRYEVSIANAWPNPEQAGAPDLVIALHARRSADSIARFADRHPDRPLIVVLTGTDLYRDIESDAAAQRSLEHATRLVVLQSEGIAALPVAVRVKAEAIVQSSQALKRGTANKRSFDLVFVGHMRAEKDPLTALRAFERVRADRTGNRSVRLIHIGEALDATYRRAAEQLGARNAGYRWLGALSHGATRQRIKRAHALLITSVMEGGAHVVIEAITSGVPVIASAIPGNIGLLGRDYAGTFPAGDDAALAALILRARDDAAFLALLARQCAARAPLFLPEREKRRLITLVGSCLAKNRRLS